MRVSKSRRKFRPAQPRAERLREIPEFAGTGEVPEPLTAVRARGYRRCRPAVPRRAVVVSLPAEPIPHVHAGQATPGRPLTAPPLRPDRPDHLQACGFVQMRLHDGIDAGLLTVICERTRERQAIRAGRRVRSPDVLEVPGGRVVVRGVAEHIRPGNGPESAARVAREWSGVVGVQDTVHRARVNVGKRLHPELQREAEGRVGGRSLPHSAGGEGANRAAQADLRPHRALRLTGMQDAGGGGPPACRPSLCGWREDHGPELETKSLRGVRQKSILEGGDDEER